MHDRTLAIPVGCGCACVLLCIHSCTKISNFSTASKYKDCYSTMYGLQKDAFKTGYLLKGTLQVLVRPYEHLISTAVAPNTSMHITCTYEYYRGEPLLRGF